MASTSHHRPDIDGLRALAVGLVLVFHFRLVPGLGDAGFLGVDVFFVISGYLITRIVVRDLDASRCRRSAGYAAGVAAALGLFAASAHSGELPGRFSPEVAQTAAVVLDGPPPLTECEWVPGATSGDRFPCVSGSRDVEPGWLVYGDSHAWAAYPALEAWLRERGESARFAFRYGCPPLKGVDLPNDRGACRGFNNAMLAFVQGAPAPRRVLLISTWVQAAEGLLMPAPEARPSVEPSLRMFWQGFDATLQALHADRAEVWVWAPVAGERDWPPGALACAMQHRRPAPALACSEAEDRDRHTFFFDALSAQGERIARVVEPALVFCHAGTCAVVAARRSLYVTASHVSRAAAPPLVRALESAHAPAAGAVGATR